MTPTHDDPDALHERAPTTRFSNRADDYARFRPTYPGEAIEAMLAGLGDPSRLVAADVGAGTGISARLLAARGVHVLAIEPNRAMRDAAEPHPLVAWRDGRAEATGLGSASVGLVLCAQAFHWFEPASALAEFHRVLTPTGRLALVWNQRDERDPATAEFTRLVRVASNDDPAGRRDVRPEVLFESRHFRHARALTFRHVQALDADGLVGRAYSASYVPKEGPAHDVLVAALHTLPGRFAGPDRRVSIAYATEVYLAERSTDSGEGVVVPSLSTSR